MRERITDGVTEKNGIISEQDANLNMNKTSNNFTNTDNQDESNDDDFDSSLNRNPLSQAMVTKMTGFNRSAYNKSNFDYEENLGALEAIDDAGDDHDRTDDEDNELEESAEGSESQVDLIAEGGKMPKIYQDLTYEPEVVHDELIKENAINSLETSEFK